MPDEIQPPVTPTVLHPDQPEVITLINSLITDATLARLAYANYKVGGMPALLKVLPDVITDGKATVEAVEAAIPVIKAGYKTTEFWLSAGLLLANGVMTLTGHTIPLDVNAVIAGVVAVYTAARALTKQTTAVK